MELELQKPELSEYPLKIHNYIYNGFYGHETKGWAKYTGRFIKWINDPGIAEVECSDDKLRYIPAWAIEDYPEHLPSMPDYDKMKKEGTFLWFGYPSKS